MINSLQAQSHVLPFSQMTRPPTCTTYGLFPVVFYLPPPLSLGSSFSFSRFISSNRPQQLRAKDSLRWNFASAHVHPSVLAKDALADILPPDEKCAAHARGHRRTNHECLGAWNWISPPSSFLPSCSLAFSSRACFYGFSHNFVFFKFCFFYTCKAFKSIRGLLLGLFIRTGLLGFAWQNCNMFFHQIFINRKMFLIIFIFSLCLYFWYIFK